MALFAVNTGCRDCRNLQLAWDWEVDVPELGTSVFIIPGSRVKNGEDRLVVLNSVAAIRGRRAARPACYARLHVSMDSADRSHADLGLEAGAPAGGLPQVRVHDLKHTFGRRLRAAGVSFEDRQDLLGHRSGRITTHYSAAELSRLIEAAEQCVRSDGRAAGTGGAAGRVARRVPQNSRKTFRWSETAIAKSLKDLVAEAGLEPATYGL